MSLEKKLLNLKEDIKYVKDGVEFSKPAIIGEVYPNPTNLCLDEFSSVYAFIEATEKLVEELEKIIEELDE